MPSPSMLQEEGWELMPLSSKVYVAYSEIIIKKLPKISLSPQQAEGYSREIFRFATSNFCLLKSVAASCGVLYPDFKIKEKFGREEGLVADFESRIKIDIYYDTLGFVSHDSSRGYIFMSSNITEDDLAFALEFEKGDIRDEREIMGEFIDYKDNVAGFLWMRRIA